ncbi:MAG: metallophosphoesterase family protein [Thermoplasmata archaeon]
MKVCFVSDIHGDQSAVRYLECIDSNMKLDLIVICGDITTFGPASAASTILRNLNTRCAAIPGNCDPEDVARAIESNCISLHLRRVPIDGVDFVGIGGAPVCSMSTPLEMSEADIEQELSRVIVDDCILVTHAPPYGINDLTRSGKRLGSRAIAKLVSKHHPRLVASGHVHEARGIVEKDGTIFINPGTLKDGFCILADIDGKIEARITDIRGFRQNL